jgi:hypothetical protein
MLFLSYCVAGSGGAYAQNAYLWDGFYAGVNAGAERGLKGAWSMSAEYLPASLGKASSSVGTCGGTVAKCAAFSGILFGDTHDASRADLFRIGVTYWFNYWD